MPHHHLLLGVGALLRCARLGLLALATPAPGGALALVAVCLSRHVDGTARLSGTLRNATTAPLPACAIRLVLLDAAGRLVATRRRHVRALLPGACATFRVRADSDTAARFRLQLADQGDGGHDGARGSRDRGRAIHIGHRRPAPFSVAQGVVDGADGTVWNARPVAGSIARFGEVRIAPGIVRPCASRTGCIGATGATLRIGAVVDGVLAGPTDWIGLLSPARCDGVVEIGDGRIAGGVAAEVPMPLVGRAGCASVLGAPTCAAAVPAASANAVARSVRKRRSVMAIPVCRESAPDPTAAAMHTS